MEPLFDGVCKTNYHGKNEDNKPEYFKDRVNLLIIILHL